MSQSRKKGDAQPQPRLCSSVLHMFSLMKTSDSTKEIKLKKRLKQSLSFCYICSGPTSGRRAVKFLSRKQNKVFLFVVFQCKKNVSL